MIKKKKPYKPTKTVTIKDVQKPYAEMYDFLGGSKYGPRSKTGQLSSAEIFNDMVMMVAEDYMDEKEAHELLQEYKDSEHQLEKIALKNEHS